MNKQLTKVVFVAGTFDGPSVIDPKFIFLGIDGYIFFMTNLLDYSRGNKTLNSDA